MVAAVWLRAMKVEIVAGPQWAQVALEELFLNKQL